MSNAEPLGVAFVEIEPVAAGFRAKTEAQLRTQLAGVNAGIPPSPATAGAISQTRVLTGATGEAAAAMTALSAEERAGAVAAGQKAAAEDRAAAATGRHSAAANAARNAVLAETATMTGLRGASLGVSPAFLGATVAAVAFFKSLDQADQFVEKMRIIQFSARATETEMEEVSRVARELGGDLDIPGSSAVKAAEAIQLLVQSGQSLAEAQISARSALLLSAGSASDLGAAVGATDDLLDAFNLSVDQSAQIADTLATATQFSQGSMEDFASALQAVAPISNAFGLTLGQTTGLLIQLAEGGVDASQTGSLIRQTFLKLANPTKAARTEIERLGISLEDTQGNLRPDIFVQFGEALEGVSRAEQRRSLATIFSARGVRSALILADQGRETFERQQAAATRTGVALEQAAARAESARGRFRELKSDAADLGVVLGGPVSTALGTIADGLALDIRFLTGVATAFGDAKDAAQDFADSFPGGGTSGLDVGAGVGRFFDDLTEGVPVLDGFFEPLSKSSKEASTDVSQLTPKVRELYEVFAAGAGGAAAQNELALGLQKLRAGLDLTTPAGKRAAAQLDALLAKVREGGKLAPIAIAFDVDERGIRDKINRLLATFNASADAPGALQALTRGLKELQAGLDETTPSGHKAAEAIDVVLAKVAEGAQLPPIPVDFDVDINQEQALADAQRAGDKVTEGFIRAGQLGFPALAQLGLDWTKALVRGIDSGQKDITDAGQRTARSFSAAATVARVRGDESGELAALRKQEAADLNLFNRLAAKPPSKAHDAAVERAGAALEATRSQIEAILADQEAETRASAATASTRADNIADAARDRDDAFIRAIQAGFGTRQGAISAAATTEPLGDDIRASIKLRNFLTKSIVEIEKRIREVRAAGRTTLALAGELADLRRAKNEVRRAIDALNADAAAQANATRIESTQLDLQILEARVGSDPTSAQTAALVRAHQRVITALKKAQSLTKRRSLEWKRLQLDIENELAAIRNLKKAQSDAAGETKDFSQQAFAFLQELHGFSSNLASNILPTGSAIGGRGVFSSAPSTSTTAAPFARPPLAPNERVLSPFEQGGGGGNASNAAALREQRGGAATFGQMEKLLNVTQNTNALLRDIRRGVGHPEARHNRLQGKHPVETGVD